MEDEPRHCAVCGAALVQREGEVPSKYAHRRTCGGKSICRYRQMNHTRYQTDDLGGLGAFPVLYEPIGEWPADLRFADARTVDFGRLPMPEAAVVFAGSTTSDCGDDGDAEA